MYRNPGDPLTQCAPTWSLTVFSLSTVMVHSAGSSRVATSLVV